MRQFFRFTDVLFDVDGVLVYPQLRFRDYLEREHGITPKMTEPFFRGRFPTCARGQAALRDELPAYLAQWGWRASVDDFISAWLREDDARDAAMLDLVAAVRRRGRRRCHVASVQERCRADYLRTTMGFASAFDTTLFSCDLGAAKPDPAFYTLVQRQLAKRPGDLMLVDDSVACVEAARAAGWSAFHYAGPADRERLRAILTEPDA